METKDIILKLRTDKGLSQEELAEKVLVTTAVSLSMKAWNSLSIFV